MSTNVVTRFSQKSFLLLAGGVSLPFLLSACSGSSSSSEGSVQGGEANLVLPDISGVTTAIGLSGRTILYIGLLLCLFGFGFGLMAYTQLQRLPVHRAMLDISELIYQTCKAYLTKQGKFLMVLWAFITAVIVIYYKALVGFSWLSLIHI